MTNEISKNLVCIQVRSGVEVWVERGRADNFIQLLAQPNAPQFIECDGNLLNRADITGIFKPDVMDSLIRRKNKQWQCGFGYWHDKDQECGHHQPQVFTCQTCFVTPCLCNR